MEMNSANVEAVVKQVLESMLEKKVPEAAPAQKAAGNEIPKTAHVAMLTALEHFEINSDMREQVRSLRWVKTLKLTALEKL